MNNIRRVFYLSWVVIMGWYGSGVTKHGSHCKKQTKTPEYPNEYRADDPSKKTTFPRVLCARAHVSALPTNRAERHIPAFPFSSVRDVGVKLPLDS